MKLRLSILSLFCFLFILLIQPQTNASEDVQSIYQKALQAYQDGQLKNAQEGFTKAFKFDPKNPFILYNRGLTEYQLEQKGLAIGLWRRALFLDPDFAPVKKALSFAHNDFQNNAFNNNLSTWESFHSRILVYISINKSLSGTLAFLILGGYFLLRYFGKRKQALLRQTNFPPFPTLGALFSLLFLVFLFLSIARGYDASIERATVITKTLPVLTGPHSDDNSLFELLEGFEVIVRQSTLKWAQVTYPGGLTGWVPKESLFITSGRNLW